MAVLLQLMVLAARIGVVQSAHKIIDEAYRVGVNDWRRIKLVDDNDEVGKQSTMQFNLFSKFPGYQILKGGDCFKFTLTPDDYGIDESIYAPFPDSLFSGTSFQTCSFTPAATCTRDSAYSFTIKMDGSTDTTLAADSSGVTRVQGTIGPLQNPFSAIGISFSVWQKTDGCPDAGGVVTDGGGRPPEAVFKAKDISSMALSFEDDIADAATSHVGAPSQIKFTFSAAYALSGFGGKITIKTPSYFTSTTIDASFMRYYTDNQAFECTADGLILVPPTENSGDGNIYEVSYLVSDFDKLSSYNSSNFEFVCQNWRNPIVPQEIDGFSIILADAKNNEMGKTYTDFKIDASSFSPHPIDTEQITFGPADDQNTVQEFAKYDLLITSPVPLQADGCYLKLVFPDDFGFWTTKFLTFSAAWKVGNRIRTLDDNGPPTLHSSDFDTRTFVFEGCRNIDRDETDWPDFTFELSMETIRNPNSTRTSGAIQVIVAKDEAFTTLVTQTTVLTMAGTKLAVAGVSEISLAVSETDVQKVVQEVVEEMSITFKSTTTVPGKNINSNYQQAVHLFFPNAFQVGESIGSVSATWAGLDAQVARDQVGDCNQDGVCYVVSIESATAIVPGEQTVVLKKGLRNPISVAEIQQTGKVKIRTMLKLSSHAADDWADVDSGDVDSTYHAVKGTIVASTIEVKTPAEDDDLGITASRIVDETYATNQLLDFVFTPKHSVPVFGFLMVRYPANTFTFSDTGTATANFVVTPAGSTSSVAVFQGVVTPGEDDKQCGGTGNSGYGCILGMVVDGDGLEAGKAYSVRLAGLRNPRVVSAVAGWQVRTFDAGPEANDGYLIDVGTGGNREISKAAPIPTFGVDAQSTVNGERTSYFITWYSEIAAEPGDKITVPFPAEIQLASTLQNREIKCVPTLDSLRDIACSVGLRDKKRNIDQDNPIKDHVKTKWNGSPGNPTVEGWQYNSKDLVKRLSGRDYAAEPNSYNLLEIELKAIDQVTGLYKVRVDFLTNPPSRRGSSPFGRVAHANKEGDLIQEYDVEELSAEVFKIPPVVILTEYGSDFKGAKTDKPVGDDVTQHNEEYSTPTTYELRFRPSSIVRSVNFEAASVKLILNYPKQVTPEIEETDVPSTAVGADKDFASSVEAKTKKLVTKGCQIFQEAVERTDARCYRSTEADLFEIHSALDTEGAGFAGVVTVKLELKNPADNWDEIGFKIRSYEVRDGSSYQVDKLEGDALRPILQCQAPCYRCQPIGKLQRPSVTDTSGFVAVDRYAKDYCTACWQPGRPQKFLMQVTPYVESSGSGESTCETSCRPGWTSNGDKKFICQRCNIRCEACEDLGAAGDRDRCKACSRQYPHSYGETCLLRCDTFPGPQHSGDPALPSGTEDVGLYQKSVDSCGACSQPCLACSQDQFNCTKCDVAAERALFQRDADGPNGRVRQGTCAQQCPTSYFMNKDAEIDGDPQWVCEECQSPCAACADSADSCLSCDGSDGRSLLWERNCWRECPKGSAADLATSKCRKCGPNCNRCSVQGAGSCLECEQPFLLEMVNGTGRCVRECSQPGYRPNNAHTLCINKTEFPEIGPIFAILSFFIFWAIVIVKYCFKKETEIIPSLIAAISVIEYFAILFQIWMCAIFQQPRYLAFTLFSFGVLMLLNIYNLYYIKTNVASRDARKQEKLSQKKVKKMIEDYKKKEKRRAAYAKAMEKYQRKKKHVESAGGGKGAYKPIDGDADNVDGDLAEGGAVDPYFLKVAVAQKRVNLRNNRNKVYDLDELSDPGSSISQRELEEMHKEIDEMDRWSEESFSSDDDDDDSDSDNQYEGGKKAGVLVLPSERFLEENGLIKKGSDAKPEYYQEKDIEDRGFNKWVDAYDRTAVAIQWISLFVTFKVYRMTYSYFMGRKQFLVLYQKKKFKKHTIAVTLLSQFLVELPLIVCGVVGVASLPIGEQLILTCLDTLAISLFLIVIEFVEIARLDKIMKTANTRGHKAKKSAAACEDSDEDGLLTDSDENEDDYPDWRLMIKNVEGNQELFATTATQLKLNELSRLYDPRVARSCVEFNTGTDKEEDPREVRSFPTSPRAYLEFEAPNFGNYGDAFDNCYAESKGPLAKDALKTYSEMGTQAQPSEILTALARKGGDLVTPGLDSDGDYSRRRGTKKKRGRKNKYITQIDAEDDEEADQMSDGSEEDGLDGIKEEDEEDEEERLAKLAKQKADAEAKAKQKKADDKKAEAARKAKEEEERRKAEEEARLRAEKEAAEAEKLKKDKSMGSHLNGQGASDNQSELSLMMAQSATLKGFGNKGGQVMEVPPTAASRRFNECDIIGNLDRDEKGNVIVGQGEEGKGGKGAAAGGVRASGTSGASGGLGGSKGAAGLGASGGAGGAGGKGGAAGKDGGDGAVTPHFFDKEGKPTNERGYLIDPKTGDVINNMNGEKMFSAKDLDEKGEVPAPFNVEKHNFNPHLVRGDFDYDRNGKPKIEKDASGAYVDKRGNRVSSRGYRIDQAGNVLDNYNRKKLDKAHTTSDGDLPKLFNYNGRRFDVCDIIGQLDKDANGNILPLTDQQGNLVDNKGRRINSKGYLVDEFGNVIDKDGRQIFEAKHLSEDEIPKIFPFTKFNIKNVLGDFEMDPLGNPILDKDAAGNLIDRQGRRVNSKGYLIDKDGNVINRHGKLMFPKKILDSEDDIPKVFRTGLLKSDTASSLSRLMSEIGKNQPSEFDQEEQRIQEEIAQNIRRQKRGNSGNTSVDSMMEDTPANYNFQNQRFEGDMGEGEGEDGEDEEDEYGSQYDQVMGQTGLTQGAGHELAKKRRKKKKKKKKKKQEMEDPSLREHLLAGAYGGVAKPKPKRQGVKYTTDLNAGLRDLATPGEVPMGNFMRDPSKKMIASLSGFANMAGQAPESSRGKRNKTIRSSHGRSEIGSNIGSRVGGGMKRGDTTSKLLDPQQREEQLKQEQMDEINARKAAKLAARKRKLAGKPGKISKDADFEKMFGKDIDEFLEDSEWDIESIDKMSQFSKNSKQTIRSAAQAGKLRGLEKLYLQRIETSMNKNTLQMTGQPGAGMQKGKKKKDGFRGDSSEQDGSLASPAKLPQKAKQAWDTGSRKSRGSQFKGTK